ncbi:glucose-1-phosphate cytidylyltransferase [Geothrix oryzae]|uniref:Glucose-1-phosphate cytidylyltransferase n=1 Tax=Geothrix oryzae TaxID=2927975 RepID=A0ABM8DUI2_9BACT|nr:glucose-1-phosphate cytidylyltransferase [Geothrix oryzae]BDU70722.1 glucose-1-phosphate cytidylyltransferase [Geothrix oryzae]
MQAVILCGGKGTRLREETEFKPKPMIRVGDQPILWHIQKHFATHGVSDFVLCMGYKAELIRDYFLNYDLNHSDVLLELGTKHVVPLEAGYEEKNWRIWMVDTGQETNTGGRLKRIQKYIQGPTFLATYGDGVADVDIPRLLAFHASHGKLATVTAVRPSSRFGELGLSGDSVTLFAEKPQVREGWINGGFFVFQQEVLDLIEGDEESLELGLLRKLSERDELRAYFHEGFWQCMDTYREMELLQDLWHSGHAPWKTW